MTTTSQNGALRNGVHCLDCGAVMVSETCWSCHGAAPSWACMCEECGGNGQLILCPDRARHSSSTAGPRMDGRNYWDASDGQCSNPFHCKSGG
jgi:predicted amidophosphoribosyltransferase